MDKHDHDITEIKVKGTRFQAVR